MHHDGFDNISSHNQMPCCLALFICLFASTSNIKPSLAFTCPTVLAASAAHSDVYVNAAHQTASSLSRCQRSSLGSSFYSSRTDEHTKGSATALNYASRAASSDDGGPMSKVDSNKSGGCPFLDTSYVYKTYAVPALFSEEGTSNEFNLDLFLGLHCCIFSFEFGSCMSCKIYYAQPFFLHWASPLF